MCVCVCVCVCVRARAGVCGVGQVHRRPDPAAIAAAHAARRRELSRIITSANQIGTELLPGQQVMARLGVTQKRQQAREFAPAIVVDGSRGGQYYRIR